MWLHNEISLFKQNIEMLRVNQRIGRLAYLWGVLGLMVSKFFVNVNIRMYNFDDVQCTVIPSVAYGFVTGMNLQLC